MPPKVARCISSPEETREWSMGQRKKESERNCEIEGRNKDRSGGKESKKRKSARPV